MPNPSLSKIKLNGVEYELEDAVARAATAQMADEIAGISGLVSSVNGKTGAVVLDANDIGALPNDTPIPAAVTEQTVSGWGFTKNTGTYTKPMGGIPDSDIASAETWNAKGTYSKPSGGIPASDLAAGVIPDISGKANATDVYTKTEIDQKLVGVMDYKGTKATVSALPTSGNETGDVWHITADGSEWAWNGSAWEELGSAVDLSGYRTASAQDTIDVAQNSAIAAKYTKPSGGIPKSDLTNDVQTSLGKADTALQVAPVTSVNRKTGAVVLGVDDGFAIYVTPEQFGAKGDGTTDDTLAIQAALDAVSIETSDRNNTGNGLLYMANKVYKTTDSLLINSNVHMKCDGRILYEGTGSAVIVDGRYSFVEIAMISAPNGTGLEFAASRHNHETMTNSVRVDRIRPCKRGIYLHDHEGEHAVTCNYIYCDQIDSGGGGSNPGTYGIEVFADHHWLTEIHYYIGHVMNFQIGVYVHSSDYEDSASVLELRAGAQRFHRIQIEGTPGAETICGIKVHNSGGLHFHDTRLNENFGQNQVVLSGKVQRCEFNFDFVDLRKIDFSGVTKAASNWFRGLTYNSGGYTHFGYEYCLTNNPTGDGMPCIIPMGRTVTVRIGMDSYQTVIDLATLGIAVQAVTPDAANTAGAMVYSLARIDRTNEIIYFTGIYPTPTMDGCSLLVYKLENTTDSSGNPKWTKSEGTVYFQMQKSRVTEITSSSKDTEYPTAKAVWNIVDNSTVTEQIVTGWGFTKNTGTYNKPSDGIPKSDLVLAVQTSLDKADTALQKHQSLSGYATESWVEDKGYLTLNDLPVYSGGVI